MHDDDQIRGLLRTLEADREPDPAFADALYERLLLVARNDARRRLPLVLLAAALLGLVVAGVAAGSSLLRLPEVVEASPRPSASSVASSPVASAAPSASAKPALAFEAPDGVLPPNATVIATEPLELRQWPVADAEVTANVAAGDRLAVAGPLLVNGERWYNVVQLEPTGSGGYVQLDPTAGSVEVGPVACPADPPTLAIVAGLSEWERLACYGDRELTLDGHEIVGFGGYQPGTYEPEWLNGFGGLALSEDGEEILFVRVEPGTVDTSRPAVTGEMGIAFLSVTGRFNHPASGTCRTTDIPISDDPAGPTADLEPIAAELACREQFVLTSFEVVDEGVGEVAVAGRVLFAAADGLRIREEADSDARIVATLGAGQQMLANGDRIDADGMAWYRVRIGPGDLSGWIAGGPDNQWLRLVHDGAIAFQCDPCPDGSGLATVIPFSDSGITVLGSEFLDWAWAPDGSQLAATLARDSGTSVVVMGIDGRAPVEIGPGGYGPNWSPDASRLAWAIGSDIVVTDEALNATPLGLDLRSAGAPHWSADGRRIAFTTVDCPDCPEPIIGDPPSAVFVVEDDGGNLRQVVNGGYDTIGEWAPDGSRLGLARLDLSGGSPPQAFTLSAEGSQPEFLLSGGTALGPPDWSPDGTRMALFDEDGLLAADGGGANPRRLVDGQLGAAITDVGWSPSGQYVVFTTNEGLWVVPADGSGDAMRILSASARQVAWQPVLVSVP